MTDYLIGIDAGGSKTHAILMDKNRTILDDEVGGSANIATNLPHATETVIVIINNLLQKHKLQPQNIALGIGVAGYSVVEKREAFITRLKQLKFKQLQVVSDCHLACLAAFNGNNGTIVICGTGVVAYNITSRQGSQLGGWGFPAGDIGGAAWFGLEICRLICKAVDNVIPWSKTLSHIHDKIASDNEAFKLWVATATTSQFAGITRHILVEFTSHMADPYINEIIHRAIAELSAFIIAVSKKWSGSHIKLAGGLSITYLPYLQMAFPTLTLNQVDAAAAAGLLFT